MRTRSARLGFIVAAVVSACGGGTADVANNASSSSSGATTSGGTSTSSSGGTTTTSSSGGTTPTVPAGFTATSADVFAHFESIKAQGFDGAVFRQANGGDFMPAPTSCSAATPDPRNTREAKIGDACSGAADKTKCAEELACIYSATGFDREGGYQIPSHYYFVFGQAGKLTTVTNRADLLAKLGKIDTPEKAMVLVALESKFRARVVGYRAADGGSWDVQLTGGGSCTGSAKFDQTMNVAPDGTVKELSKTVATEPEPPCSEGRRPIGLVDCPRGGQGRSLADYLAEAAHLEAAAVVAFEQMAETLRAHGAPERLVRATEAARRDEIRHARTMSTLARAHGAEPLPVRVEAPGAIDLETLAIDNAVEGCVRETYAVVRALWQSQHAEDPRVRAALATIARDESRHAELSWALAEWLETKLDAIARARVETARAQAIAELRTELRVAPHPDVARHAGMPSAATALRLLDELVTRLELPVAA